MCVIIDRTPGKTVPFGMLERACDINKHGYGIAFADRGKLEIIRVTKQPNDPEEVAKRLEQLKKHRVFLHLRHATVGSVTEENQHPFVPLTQGKKKIPLIGFMHNGTLYGQYTPPWEDKQTSDTLLFNNKLVRPLFERVNRTLGTKRVLQDNFVMWLLSKEIGNTSKMLFFDAFGGTLHFNKSGGKEYDWGWSSNEYSFDDTHHRSSARSEGTGTAVVPFYQRGTKGRYINGVWRPVNDTSTYDTSGLAYGSDLEDLPWMQETNHQSDKVEKLMSEWEKHFEGAKENYVQPANTDVPVKSREKDHIRRRYEMLRYQYRFKSVQNASDTSIYIMKDNIPTIRDEKVKRKTFLEETGLPSHDHLGCFSEDDLVALASDFPQATAALVVDLLYERLLMKKGVMGTSGDRAKIEQLEGRLKAQKEFIDVIKKDWKFQMGTDYV